MLVLRRESDSGSGDGVANDIADGDDSVPLGISSSLLIVFYFVINNIL